MWFDFGDNPATKTRGMHRQQCLLVGRLIETDLEDCHV